MSHLLGCHGEWLFLLQALAMGPVAIAWLRAVLKTPQGQSSD